MKIRFWLAACTAVGLAATGTVATGARADSPAVDTNVGGSVAPVILVAGIGAQALTLVNQPAITQLTLADPQAVMGQDGGTLHVAAAEQNVSLVHVGAVEGTITGRRDGQPFADGTTSLADVSVGSLKIGTVSTHCRWDLDRSYATTTIQAGVVKFNPAINKTTNVPGVGTVIENQQYTSFEFATDANGNTIVGPDGFPLEYLTKVVVGVHVILDPALAQLYGYADVFIGFASCDPLSLPNLSGIARFTPSTDS